jgi:uncharacterized protein YcbX
MLERIYIYPIKSLRPYEVQSATIGHYGLIHDRTFMFAKVHRDERGKHIERLENMHIAYFPKMALFLPSLELIDGANAGYIIVKYGAPKTTLDEKPISDLPQDEIRIPLQVRVESLESVDLKMHESPTTAYNMGPQYNDWFSERFKHEVMLLYLGANSREVLGSVSPSANMSPPLAAPSYLFSTLRSMISSTQKSPQEQARIGFQDCAQFLVVTSESLSNVSSRLPPDQPMDVTKFRPNILLSGSPGPWAEDYWGELMISSAHQLENLNGDQDQDNDNDKVIITLTANCVRCQSINIDYATGAPGTDESGTVLKKLQRDRRVDKGAKWSPCFGRYGFVARSDVGKKLVVGERVVVTRVNEERTVFGEFVFCFDLQFLCHRRR